MSPRGHDLKRTNDIMSVLATTTHQLHLAERDVRTSLPLVAARLRAARALVAGAKEALRVGVAEAVRSGGSFEGEDDDDEPTKQEG
jgi:hypothetical protein